MSQSIQEPPFGEDIYFYYQKRKVKGKWKEEKIRVRISEKRPNGYYTLQRVRDGYTLSAGEGWIGKLIKE